jgi:hypothetical protein
MGNGSSRLFWLLPHRCEGTPGGVPGGVAAGTSLSNPLNDVDAGIRVNQIRDLTDLESERGILEGLLHHPAREHTQVPTLLGGTAVGVRMGNILKFVTYNVLNGKED